MKRILLGMLVPFGLLALWELFARTGVLDARFFPPPTVILHYLVTESWNDGLLSDVGASLYRVAWGYVAGCFFGALVGLGMGMLPLVRTLLFPMVSALYPIPKIAVLPLIMLVFGLGDLSKIVVVAIGSFFLMLLNTLLGVENLPPIYRDLRRIFAIKRVDYVFRVVIPGALPSIFTGLKLAIGYSLVIVVAAEFSGANAGIGYRIWQSWETFSIKSMYASIVVIAILGFIFAFTLDRLERRLIPWRDLRRR